jgi:glycosyltransferase involved in cell wall biosynthesis
MEASGTMALSDVPVSVLIPMLNEEANIAACLESLQALGDIWVVDSHSTDKSPAIAESQGAKVVQFSYQPGGPKKKNWALDNLPFKHPWVFIVDCDERATPELVEEIGETVAQPGEAVGYHVNRRVYFLGRWLRHCWYPSWNLRLFQHRRGRYERLESGHLQTGDNEVHEHVLLDGPPAGFLTHDLLHYDYRSLHHFLDRHNRYSTWEAEQRHREWNGDNRGLQASFWGGPLERRRRLKQIFLRVPGKPLWRFLYTYLWRRGFLDGYAGFLISAYMAVYEFEIGMKIYEMRHSPPTNTQWGGGAGRHFMNESVHSLRA